jgi:hypothetical protein
MRLGDRLMLFLLRISSLAGKGMKVATFKDGRQSNLADTRSQSSLIALEKNFMRNVPIWNQFRKHGHVLKCGPRSWRTKLGAPEQ